MFRSVIPSFCVSRTIKTINALALKYLVAFYPIFLIAITYLSNSMTTADQLFGYGSHFTNILFTSGGDGTHNQCFHNLSASFSKILFVSSTLLYTLISGVIEMVLFFHQSVFCIMTQLWIVVHRSLSYLHL